MKEPPRFCENCRHMRMPGFWESHWGMVKPIPPIPHCAVIRWTHVQSENIKEMHECRFANTDGKCEYFEPKRKPKAQREFEFDSKEE